MELLEVNHLCKTYGSGETAVHALKDVSFSVPKGEYVAVVGESGSGKSTLLNLIGGLDTPTSGKVLIEVSPDFYRPTDVVNLWGDPTKARQELGWNPTKTSFEELVKIMVEHDMEKVAVERAEENIRCNLEEYLEKGVVK